MHSNNFWNIVALEITKKYGKGNLKSWRRSQVEEFLSHLDFVLSKNPAANKKLNRRTQISYATFRRIFQTDERISGSRWARDLFSIYLGYDDYFDFIERNENISLQYNNEKSKSEKKPSGILVLKTKKDFSIGEVIDFLNDLKFAYENLYKFLLIEFLIKEEEISNVILPKSFQLKVNKIKVSSPGIWEFLGALNPLEQIREYLKERHERKKDKEYKNKLEEKSKEVEIEGQRIENQKLRISIYSDELNNQLKLNEVILQQIKLLKELGFTEEEIKLKIDKFYSYPLLKLNKHMEYGLIDDVEIKKLE